MAFKTRTRIFCVLPNLFAPDSYKCLRVFERWQFALKTVRRVFDGGAQLIQSVGAPDEQVFL